DIFKVRAVLYVTMLEQVVRENSDGLQEVLDERMPKLAKAAEESVDAYAVESFLLNFAIVDLCANRLLVDMLQSISLRTLRYARLGLSAAPQSIPASLKTWRALQNAAQKRDEKLLLSVAQKRLDEARDAALRALKMKPGVPVVSKDDKGSATREHTAQTARRRKAA
ncbi:FCD domain-containing protein, partial [Cupriavidus basilensis]|uniref:FCD domain-containing protein n=3 Tax=Cupriavidus TaxID=106589 RepID=UPI0023E7BC32